MLYLYPHITFVVKIKHATKYRDKKFFDDSLAYIMFLQFALLEHRMEK